VAGPTRPRPLHEVTRVYHRPASPKSWNARSIAVLPAPHMPVRIVVGEEDYATPLAMSQALHRGIAGSILTVIANARHLTPLECPERIIADLQKLLEMAPAQ
jgi:pimeloyl-ACP methyl ester carboxylesterase